MDIIKSIYRFSLFFNFFIFMLTLVSSDSIYSIPVRFKVGSISFSYSVNLITMMFIILVIFGLIILAGLQLFGGGFNDASVQLLIKLTAYILIWVVMSIFTLNFLYPLQDLGQMIFVATTIGYAMGFLQGLSFGGQNNE